jgi:hypothetical protein
VFFFNETAYGPLDFADSVIEPNVSNPLSQTLICLEGDVNCYIPIQLVDPESTTGDETVKCWKNWCYVVGEPFTFTQPNITDETNVT